MIWLDVTKSAAARHRSGLTRVTMRLAEELGAAATRWSAASGRAGPTPGVGKRTPFEDYRLTSRGPMSQIADRWGSRVIAIDLPEDRCADTFLTAEVFAPSERPGFDDFLARRPCRCVAIYHDSIPLRLPQITWPQAVARHPAYLSMLAQFDLVWAVSAASREELLGFWQWQGRTQVPEVRVLALGADLNAIHHPTASAGGARPSPYAKASGDRPGALDAAQTRANAQGGRVPPMLLCVGILEPRKNQTFLLEVADRLWAEGIAFELHFVGRVNPHFGKPVLANLRALQRKRAGLSYDGPMSDQRLAELYQSATTCVFPTIAEGCGLPLLEALWWGTPCVASDLPSLVENARGGGCLVLPTNQTEAWTLALRRILTEPNAQADLADAARRRQPQLPTWAQAAGSILRDL